MRKSARGSLWQGLRETVQNLRGERGQLKLAAFATCGMTIGDWVRVFRGRRMGVDPIFLPAALLGAAVGLANGVVKQIEEWRFGSALAGVQVKEPIFILGHWRSGTTLLHELLTLDERFAYPSLFQVMRPHTFLMERTLALKLAHLDAGSRPMDNLRVTVSSPAEDEWALALMSFHSPYMGWLFPRYARHYDRYLTFRGVPEKLVAEWKQALLRYMKKLTYLYGKPLVIKSPTHTGRIRLLLELFPDARFVHICRNPYDVYRSTRRFYRKAVRALYLQKPRHERLRADILRRYQLIYEAFFEERDLVPEGQFSEVHFEDLEADMEGQMERIYDELQLGGFEEVRPRIQEYAQAHAGYQKNRYQPLPRALRQQIAQAWGRAFQEWGYSV
ncbi:MAG: sulfotransferase [Chloroflexi bacterium]|nr:sulfotransferase [Chloroflexota bacterium]